LVWALDRLSREGALAILSLVNKLSSCGVKVLSYQESWTEAPGELAELLYEIPEEITGEVLITNIYGETKRINSSEINLTESPMFIETAP